MIPVTQNKARTEHVPTAEKMLRPEPITALTSFLQLSLAQAGILREVRRLWRPNLAAETTDEKRLQIDVGVSPLFTHEMQEIDTRLTFSKPWIRARK